MRVRDAFLDNCFHYRWSFSGFTLQGGAALGAVALTAVLKKAPLSGWIYVAATASLIAKDLFTKYSYSKGAIEERREYVASQLLATGVIFSVSLLAFKILKMATLSSSIAIALTLLLEIGITLLTTKKQFSPKHLTLVDASFDEPTHIFRSRFQFIVCGEYFPTKKRAENAVLSREISNELLSLDGFYYLNGEEFDEESLFEKYLLEIAHHQPPDIPLGVGGGDRAPIDAGNELGLEDVLHLPPDVPDVADFAMDDEDEIFGFKQAFEIFTREHPEKIFSSGDYHYWNGALFPTLERAKACQRSFQEQGNIHCIDGYLYYNGMEFTYRTLVDALFTTQLRNESLLIAFLDLSRTKPEQLFQSDYGVVWNGQKFRSLEHAQKTKETIGDQTAVHRFETLFIFDGVEYSSIDALYDALSKPETPGYTAFWNLINSFPEETASCKFYYWNYQRFDSHRHLVRAKASLISDAPLEYMGYRYEGGVQTLLQQN